MERREAKAIARQKLDRMQGYTLDEILTLLWGKDLSAYVVNDTDKCKLIGMGIVNLQYQLDVSRAGLRRAHAENARLSNAPELFTRPEL